MEEFERQSASPSRCQAHWTRPLLVVVVLAGSTVLYCMGEGDWLPGDERAPCWCGHRRLWAKFDCPGGVHSVDCACSRYTSASVARDSALADLMPSTPVAARSRSTLRSPAALALAHPRLPLPLPLRAHVE